MDGQVLRRVQRERELGGGVEAGLGRGLGGRRAEGGEMEQGLLQVLVQLERPVEVDLVEGHQGAQVVRRERHQGGAQELARSPGAAGGPLLLRAPLQLSPDLRDALGMGGQEVGELPGHIRPSVLAPAANGSDGRDEGFAAPEAPEAAARRWMPPAPAAARRRRPNRYRHRYRRRQRRTGSRRVWRARDRSSQVSVAAGPAAAAPGLAPLPLLPSRLVEDHLVGLEVEIDLGRRAVPVLLHQQLRHRAVDVLLVHPRTVEEEHHVGVLFN